MPVRMAALAPSDPHEPARDDTAPDDPAPDRDPAAGRSIPERSGTADQQDDPDAPGMGVLDPESGWPEPNEPA